MDKPIIGIVSKHYSTYKSNKIDTFIRDEVKQAIFVVEIIGKIVYQKRKKKI